MKAPPAADVVSGDGAGLKKFLMCARCARMKSRHYACAALSNYLKSPQGKTQDSQDNHKDAETKKFQWKCPGQ